MTNSNASFTIKETDSEQVKAAKELLHRRRARENFLDFVTYTKPDYTVNWHHQLMAKYIQKWVDGEIKRLMIFSPPQHGKSELVSRRLPAYLLGKDPDVKVVAASYAVELAKRMSRDAQRVISSDEYKRVFPHTRLAEGGERLTYKRTNELWEIPGHNGQYRCAGVGGGITGFTMTAGIIDDPIKGAKDADSPTIREGIFSWYGMEFRSRMRGDAPILICQTRWHRDDLSGRLLREIPDNEKHQWVVLNLPAVADGELHPEDPRKLGEALWPAQQTTEQLAEIRKFDPRTFYALYQGNPSVHSGTEWPADCFDDNHIWVPDIPENTFRWASLDPSKGKQDKSHDYSAIVLLGTSLNYDGTHYVDADLQKRNATKITQDFFTFCEKYKPHAASCESDQFQELFFNLFQQEAKRRNDLGQSTHLGTLMQSGRFYQMHTHTVRKEVRIRRLTEIVTQKRLRYVKSVGSQILVDQMRDFPTAEHDDGPDALEQGWRGTLEVTE